MDFSKFCTEFIEILGSCANSKSIKDVKVQMHSSWTADEITYFYARVLLKLCIASSPMGKKLELITEELDDYMSDVAGARVISDLVEFSEVVSTDLPISIGNIKSAENKKPAASDIIKVMAIFEKHYA